MSGRKLVVGIVIVAVIGTAAVLAARNGGERGIPVRLDTVERRDLVQTVTASGNIRAGRVVDISSDVSARVQELLVDEGDDVVQGQLLLRLDPTRFTAQVERARASLDQARANRSQQAAAVERAERELGRLERLFQRDSLLVARQQLDNARSDLEIARAQLKALDHGVEQAEAALAEAEEQLSKTIFRAPISGKVTRLNVDEGETVIVGTMNNPGSLVLTISELSQVEAVVQVDETDVPYIAVGDSAVLTLDAFPDQEFSGRVTEIGNSAIVPPSQSAGTGQAAAIDFEVVIVMDDPPGGIRPDLSVTADIVTDRREDVLAVPIIALTVRPADEVLGDSAKASEGDDSGGRPEDRDVEGAFVVRDGKATFVPVEVGITGRDHFEVLSGLSEGDTVVAGPYQRIRSLKNGDPVRAMEGEGRRDDEGN